MKLRARKVLLCLNEHQKRISESLGLNFQLFVLVKGSVKLRANYQELISFRMDSVFDGGDFWDMFGFNYGVHFVSQQDLQENYQFFWQLTKFEFSYHDYYELHQYLLLSRAN